MSEFKGYENVDDFLKNTNPVEYDFKYQLGQKILGIKSKRIRFLAEEMINTQEPILRIMRYKSYQVHGKFDCDGNKNCDLSFEIYNKLWQWEKYNKDSTFGKIKDSEFICDFGGDTINSFITSYKKSKSDLKGRDDEMFRNFAILTHTIGNFTLVPAGFNFYRGGKNTYCDYWDLSLMHLKKEGYKDFKSDDFKKYIDTFFLWDYVDEEYNPLSLFMNHSDFTKRKSCEINSVPRVNYINFIDNVEYAIKRRGKFMICMLGQTDNCYDEFKQNPNFENYDKILNNEFSDWFHNFRLQQ